MTILTGDFSVELEGIKQGSSGKQSWVFALPVDEPIWNGKKMIQFSMDDLKLLQSEFIKINHEFTSLANDETPYRFPVKINHNRGSGSSYGNLVDVKIVKDKGLYLSVIWNDETWDDVQANTYKYVSAGIKPEYTTQLGNTFGPMIVELSLTEYPRVQSIGTIQDSLELRLSNIEEIEMNEETMKVIEAFVMEKVAMLKEEIMAELKAEQEVEEVEMAEEVIEEEAPAPDAKEEVVPSEEVMEEEELSNDLETRVKELEAKIADFSNFNSKEKASAGTITNVKPTYNSMLKKFIDEGMSISDATIKALKMCK